MRDFSAVVPACVLGVVVDLDQARALNVKVNGRDARYEVRERL